MWLSLLVVGCGLEKGDSVDTSGSFDPDTGTTSHVDSGGMDDSGTAGTDDSAGQETGDSDSGEHTDTGGKSPDADGDGYALIDDCDDTDASVHPGADELCNETDDDCDGAIDEDAIDAHTIYLDLDGDGFGDDSASMPTCLDTKGELTVGGDCDDTDPLVNPLAVDVCADSVDNDCDGRADECSIYLGTADSIGRGTSMGFAGSSGAFLADKNGDGMAEILIGAPNAGSGAGEAYLGLSPHAKGVDTFDNWTFTLQGSGVAGFDVGDAGDVDGDGQGDFFVSARSASSPSGAVSIVLAMPTADIDLDTDADVQLTQQFYYDQAGWSDAALGDVDGDGTDDLLVGAPNHDFGGDGSGIAYVMFGPLSGNQALTDAAVTIEAGDDEYAGGGSGGGDMDGDGTTDFLVAALLADDGTMTDVGAIYVVSGNERGAIQAPDTAFASVWGASTIAATGTQMETADIDGDGYADLVTSSPGATRAIHILSGPLSGSHSTSDAGVAFDAYFGSSQMGVSLALGDVNADGFTDLLAGAPGVDSYQGAAYLFLGAFTEGTYSAGSDAASTLDGEFKLNYAGKDVDLGDADGDGRDDLLVTSDSVDGYYGASYLVLSVW